MFLRVLMLPHIYIYIYIFFNLVILFRSVHIAVSLYFGFIIA